MSNLKISIIIPVYNTAKYLKDCLETCLDQAPFTVGKDYEIICINDGSTDNSRIILEKYYDRGVITINQNNKGVSASRNIGIDIATGEYLWFVDSDDIVKKQILSQIYDLLKSNGAEGCVFKIRAVSESGADSLPKPLRVIDIPLQMNHVTNLIFSKKYIVEHAIRFNTAMSYGEDTLFVFYLRLYKHNFIYLDNELYFYRQVSTSVMHQRNKNATEKLLNSHLQILTEYKRILDNWDSCLYSGDAKPQERYYWTIQNILFIILRVTKNQRIEIFNYLKREGHYPYPILWNRLMHNCSSKKAILINLFSLLFPLEWYYRLLMKLFK